VDFLVDAGAIVNAKGTSARDAADLVCKDLGDRAKFPIVVTTPATGEMQVFAGPEDLPQDPGPDPENDDKKPPQPDHGEFQKASA
jgi:hypothetical protein